MRWRSRARCRRGVSLRWTSSERWSWSLNRSDTWWELGEALPVLVWSTHCDVPLHWHRLHTVGVENSTLFLFFNPPLPTSCRYWHRRRRPTWGTTRWRTAWRGWRSPWTRCPPSPCWSRRGQEHWSRCTWSVRNVGEWMFTVIQDSRAIQYSSLMRKCTYNESIVSTPQSGGEGNVSPEIYSDQKLPEESSN